MPWIYYVWRKILKHRITYLVWIPYDTYNRSCTLYWWGSNSITWVLLLRVGEASHHSFTMAAFHGDKQRGWLMNPFWRRKQKYGLPGSGWKLKYDFFFPYTITSQVSLKQGRDPKPSWIIETDGNSVRQTEMEQHKQHMRRIKLLKLSQAISCWKAFLSMVGCVLGVQVLCGPLPNGEMFQCNNGLCSSLVGFYFMFRSGYILVTSGIVQSV